MINDKWPATDSGSQAATAICHWSFVIFKTVTQSRLYEREFFHSFPRRNETHPDSSGRGLSRQIWSPPCAQAENSSSRGFPPVLRNRRRRDGAGRNPASL